MTLETIDKESFEHFMLKEIFKQPAAMRDCMQGRLATDNQKLVLDGINNHIDQLAKAHKITIVACGTSWHAGLVAEYF